MSTAATAHGQDDSEAPQQSKDPDQIEAEIQATRAELSETVDALSAKLDVKSRAQHRVDDVKHQVQTTMTDPDERADALKQAAPVLAGVAVVAILLGLLRRVAHR